MQRWVEGWMDVWLEGWIDRYIDGENIDKTNKKTIKRSGRTDLY